MSFIENFSFYISHISAKQRSKIDIRVFSESAQWDLSFEISLGYLSLILLKTMSKGWFLYISGREECHGRKKIFFSFYVTPHDTKSTKITLSAWFRVKFNSYSQVIFQTIDLIELIQNICSDELMIYVWPRYEISKNRKFQ